MSKVMELHAKVMKAAADHSITDDESYAIMNDCLEQMDRLNPTYEEIKQIEKDIDMVVFNMIVEERKAKVS